MLRFTLVGLTIAAAITAQSPLTTTFANNNFGNIGGGIYFDLNVLHPGGITITGLDLNLTGTGSVDVFTLVGTRIGNQTNIAAWTLSSSGTVTGALPGVPSPVAITPFTLAPGSYGVALRGVGVNHEYTNGTGTNQNYATAELALAAGEASNAAFVAPLFTPRVVNTNIHYTVGGGGGTFATNTSLGVGCLRRSASLYESFVTAGSFDLSNSGMTLQPSAGGYVAGPGVVAFVPPTAAAALIAVGDDVEQTVPLLSAFPFPGGSTGALTVCSNGFVSVASGNGVSFTPVVAGMLAFPQTAWGDWHDFLPTGGVNGNVKFEEVGSLSIVTWDAVVDFGSATPNTWQIQFNRSTGAVHYVWGVMSLMGNGHIVFYSPGGPSSDPGSADLSVALLGGVTLPGADIPPLALAGGTRPITGTNWTLNVSNIPPTGVIGVDIFGLADPGINDLFFLGMPTCPLRSTLDSLGSYVVVAPTHSYSLAIPNNPALVNVHIFTTSAVFQVPPVNAFGAITSNGIDGKIGDV